MANTLTRSASISSDRALDNGSLLLVASPVLNRLNLPQLNQQHQLPPPAILPQTSPESRALALNRMQESRRLNRPFVVPTINRLPSITNNNNQQPSRSRAANSSRSNNIIDLTGSSPPSVALRIKGNANRRTSNSNNRAVGNGGGGAGPSGIRRNSNSNVIVIDSDDDDEDNDVLPIPPPVTVSDDDDDVVIVEGSYAAPVIPRELRRNPAQVVARNVTTGARRFPPPLPNRQIFAPGSNARQRAAQTVSNGLDLARQQFFNRQYNEYNESEDENESNDEDFDDFYDSEDGLEDFLNRQHELEEEALYGRGGSERLDLLFGFGDRVGGGGGGGEMARVALHNHIGYGNNIGLAGLMNQHNNGGGGGGKKLVKKYGIRLSHNKGVEEGFSRDIIPPPELADTPPPEPANHHHNNNRSRKNSKPKIIPIQMEPACANCLERLLLAQIGLKRSWALKCGHVICGKCLGEAKMRCEEIKDSERRNHWTFDVKSNEKFGAGSKGKGKGKGKAEVVLLVDDDEDSDDDNDKDESNFGPTRNSKNSKSSSSAPYSKTSTSATGKGKGKGKEKSLASITGVDESWTCCPVVKCGGTTDLLAKDGDFSGPFELFI